MAILKQSQFALAFTLNRSESGRHRNAAGALVTAAIDAARFDYSEAGEPRGLLTTPGSDIGAQDRVAFDPLMLPAALTESTDLPDREATVYHAFRPLIDLAADLDRQQADFASTIARRAWYSRDAATTITRLLNMAGHHLAIGVHAGFAPNDDGFARYRGQLWRLPDLLQVDGGVLSTDAGRPLIASGAEFAS
ncbi:hypothetical protein AAG607_13665 [Citromicrobium bathyomarinum]|uniref:hypothetical protein n=1 Tax=Citromicrobium bathyomarinum TaxID=72174 RepID=UPI00315A73C2